MRAEGETIRQVDYSEGLQVGYRCYQAQGEQPLFAFGHGLSYTDFALFGLKVSASGDSGDDGLTVRFRVTNSGKRTGTEVPQVYLELPRSAGEPAPRLVAWERVTLQAGQSRTVTVHLSAREIAERHLTQYWDSARDEWRTPSGTFTAHVGASSHTTRAREITLGRP
ncbi:fibronectin type III-like domain-contianing protein [Streptomyces sp. DH24]|uniref:fibronectin type III-like domain-contianing protein n=1 Tax=Streptomyces sp. DH24 TaxID=3040123 RepID=UPI0024416C68|nr:fibronectin type III-like domain-contianing protein [Streptomyces sp. DH24]MDG9715372.1 fibronectin type III-like domain-contianing protein [Streptomyces sp. DH24]